MAGRRADAAAGPGAQAWQLMEQRFGALEHALYADEATPDTWGRRLLPGGQNANMHGPREAMMAAFRATADRKYLDRAIALAKMQ